MFTLSVPWWEIVLRTLVIYVVVQRVAHRIPFVEHLFASEPTLLLEDGKVIQKHQEGAAHRRYRRLRQFKNR